MGFRSPLDIGGFVGSLGRGNRCNTCLRDKREEAKRIEQPTTEIIQRCSECGSPMVWIKTGAYGKREEWEWVRGRGPIRRRVLDGNEHNSKVRIDIN